MVVQGLNLILTVTKMLVKIKNHIIQHKWSLQMLIKLKIFLLSYLNITRTFIKIKISILIKTFSVTLELLKINSIYILNTNNVFPKLV